jgi:MFS family permease
VDCLYIFGFAGCCFGVAALFALVLTEPSHGYSPPRHSVTQNIVRAWRAVVDDRQFRRLALVAMSFGTSMMLFPHYQALGRERLGLTFVHLTSWVVVQNFGTAVFSLLAGPLADGRGNRLVLRMLFVGLFSLPLLSLYLAHAGAVGARNYWLVFLFVGVSPITVRIMNNYALEISRIEDHPRYLSALGLCIAMPIFLAPLVGLLVDWIGFETVFLAVATILFGGWLMTFRLVEPRHRPPEPTPSSSSSSSSGEA